MAKSNKGVRGVSRADVRKRDQDRLDWAEKQQQRRDTRDARSGKNGFGTRARLTWTPEDGERD